MSVLSASKVADFEQVRVMSPLAKTSAAATQGACHNFSLHWCSEILANPGANGSTRMATLGRKAGGANPILQKAFGDRWSLEGQSGADDMMLRIHGLSATSVFPYSNFNPTSLKNGILGGKGKAFIYSFWFSGSRPGAEGGAHSIAFYCTSHGGNAVVHAFDPNFGEFVLTGGELPQFLAELFALYGPVNTHDMRSLAAGARLALGGR